MTEAVKERVEEATAALSAKKYRSGAKWNGYDVYIPEYDQFSYVGLPFIVLVRGDEVRISTEDEAFEYLDNENR